MTRTSGNAFFLISPRLLNRFNNSIRIPFKQNNLNPLTAILFEHYTHPERSEGSRFSAIFEKLKI
jgi:hypothetical protein